MATDNNTGVNKGYIISVTALTVILPLASHFIEQAVSHNVTDKPFLLFGKWFIFYAVGFRLLIAGVRQAINPAFTAAHIFRIKSTEAYPVVRELGYANFCFGLIGIISLFIPSWRIVSAFGSGLYYGLAGLMHLVKKPAGDNEKFALYSDAVIFILLAIYVVLSW